MKNIISIQHCESVHHSNKMIGSWTDWDLSLNGEQQAHNIGKKLQLELKDDYIIYSSDLKRAHQTASIIAEYLQKDVKKAFELRELNLGSACGKSSEWYQNNAKPFEFSIDYKCLDDAESTRDHYQRLKPFIDDILGNEEENIILVSHGGTCSVINTILMDLPIEYMNKVRIHGKAGSVSFFNIDNNITRIGKISDNSYRE